MKLIKEAKRMAKIDIGLILLIIFGFYLIYYTLKDIKKGKINAAVPYARKPLDLKSDRNNAIGLLIVQITVAVFTIILATLSLLTD